MQREVSAVPRPDAAPALPTQPRLPWLIYRAVAPAAWLMDRLGMAWKLRLMAFAYLVAASAIVWSLGTDGAERLREIVQAERGHALLRQTLRARLALSDFIAAEPRSVAQAAARDAFDQPLAALRREAFDRGAPFDLGRALGMVDVRWSELREAVSGFDLGRSPAVLELQSALDALCVEIVAQSALQSVGSVETRSLASAVLDPLPAALRAASGFERHALPVFRGRAVASSAMPGLRMQLDELHTAVLRLRAALEAKSGARADGADAVLAAIAALERGSHDDGAGVADVVQIGPPDLLAPLALERMARAVRGDVEQLANAMIGLLGVSIVRWRETEVRAGAWRGAAVVTGLTLPLFLLLGFMRSLWAGLRGLARVSAGLAEGRRLDAVDLGCGDELQALAVDLVEASRRRRETTRGPATGPNSSAALPG